jgi:hypothetical protein
MNADCCGTGYVGRRYYTKDERRDWLERYATSLEHELTAVKERLAALAA